MKKVMEEMSYRIEELEKKMEEMGKYKMEEKEETEKVEPISEMSLPKLDGAPIEDSPAQRVNKFGKKVQNSQSAFLSRLYK
jgi:hypothetical protein